MTTNKQFFDRRAHAVARGVGAIHPVAAARADNARVWDVEGREYLDFAGGIAVVNTGHRHPRLLEAVRAQMECYTHTCFHVLGYEGYVALAERLNALVPGDFVKKTALLNTGAEAVENAVKIARAYTGRSAVIAFGGGFHGRTLLTMGLTGKVSPYKTGFGPFPAELLHARYPNPLHGVSLADALRSVEELLKFDVEPERVAAFIIEPVLGEGGFYAAPADFLRGLRALADRHGIVLIADEVQTGFGRTGRLFAMEHSGVAADLTTMAKGLAGGFPLAAVTGRAEIMDAPHPGGLGGTYGGNPLSCAAALAVLEVIEAEGLLERSRRNGERLQAALQSTAAALDVVADVRGLGSMVAIEFGRTQGGACNPLPELAGAVVAEARRQGLILLSCGIYGNVVRLLPPLTATDADIEEAAGILQGAIRAAAGAAASEPA